MPLSWKSQRCAYLPRFCKVEHTGITGVYIFSTPLLSPDLWIIYFSSPFVLVSLLAQKVFLASRPWKYLLYFFCACVCGVFPPRCGNSFLFKAGGEAKQPGPVSQTKKTHTLGKKKSRFFLCVTQCVMMIIPMMSIYISSWPLVLLHYRVSVTKTGSARCFWDGRVRLAGCYSDSLSLWPTIACFDLQQSVDSSFAASR